MIQQAVSTMIYMLLARFMLNDMPHAAGLFNPTSKLTRQEFESLPIAYRGFDPARPEPDIIHVTPDMDIAKYHGKYTMTGRVLPGKLRPDPEIEGFEARRLTGIESFNLGSARIPREYYWPENYELYLEAVGGKPDYERDPTPGQLRYITVLSQRLGITVQYEEQVRTFGEAGRMISELKAEEKYRRLKGGSPGTLRVERTTVDLIADDLERTWRRIDSDMSTRMQSSLNILKSVLGNYYYEPCVAAYGDGDLVGVAVYGTTYDLNLNIRDTRIREIASFTYEPGVGKVLVGEVVNIARGESSDIVSASYGPGARGFYEGLGFVKNVYYPEEPTLMMYRLKR